MTIWHIVFESSLLTKYAESDFPGFLPTRSTSSQRIPNEPNKRRKKSALPRKTMGPNPFYSRIQKNVPANRTRN